MQLILITATINELIQMRASLQLIFNRAQLYVHMITNSCPISSNMDGDLYDEFGNYIGPELESESEASSDEEETQDAVSISTLLISITISSPPHLYLLLLSLLNTRGISTLETYQI